MKLPFPDSGHGPYRLLRRLTARPVDLLHRACVDPESVQRARLAVILGEARPDLDEFRSRYPVRTFDEQSDALREVRGASAYVKTSGTTGPSKLLPVTAAWAQVVEDGQALWRLGLVRDWEAVVRGKALTVVSPAVQGQTDQGVPYGSNTGRMQQAQPWYIRNRYPVPEAVYAIPDAEARVYAILRYALQAKISLIVTANPSTVLLLCRKLLEHADDLAADLYAGTLERGPAAGLGDDVKKGLKRRRTPPDDWRPARIWKLAVVCCWKGGPAPFFLRRFREALGRNVPVRDVGVTASEGYFAIPLSDGDEGGVAWLGGHVLELVGDDGHPRWAWEADVGGIYRLVITTSAGLRRYDLQDLVQVTGFVGRAPVLRFVRKAGNVLSVTGEKVTEEQVVAAMAAALGDQPAVGFTVGHRLADVPVLRVAVEGIDQAAGPALAERFDVALRAGNSEYDDKRSSGRLGAPDVEVLPGGTYARYRAARAAEGAPAAQVKDPVVALDAAAWARVDEAARG